tara:strand:- start:215 stop:388 length:174 start_codon:yes stop_codon:yes gene_type:complete
MSIKTDTNWEIEQLHIAIGYYEKEVQDTPYVREAIELSETVHKLNKRLKDLERGRNS